MTDEELAKAIRLATLPPGVGCPSQETEGLDTEELMSLFARAVVVLDTKREVDKAELDKPNQIVDDPTLDKLVEDLLEIDIPGRDAGDAMRTIQEAVAAIAALRAERDEWKRRAAAHGCDVERGDPDCG